MRRGGSTLCYMAQRLTPCSVQCEIARELQGPKSRTTLDSGHLCCGLAGLQNWGLDPIDDRLSPGYTFGMKTAISLPDKVFREAERFARRVRKTRSRLYAEALAEYLARHAPDDITESMNQVCDRIGLAPDTFTTKAARGLLTQESW